jgi:hypothetical protein
MNILYTHTDVSSFQFSTVLNISYVPVSQMFPVFYNEHSVFLQQNDHIIQDYKTTATPSDEMSQDSRPQDYINFQ